MSGAAREVGRMAPGRRQQMARGATKAMLLVVVLVAAISGVTAAPFTIVANVNSQTMVHVGGGAFFPQPEVSVQCPEIPGLECRSRVDGHQIIINVFHHTAKRESIESTENKIENDASPWWPFKKPDRVSEQPYDISESADISTTEMKSEEEQEQNEEGYGASRQSNSNEGDHRNPSEEDDKGISTDHDNSDQDQISGENDSPNERENEIEPKESNNEDVSENEDGNDGDDREHGDDGDHRDDGDDRDHGGDRDYRDDGSDGDNGDHSDDGGNVDDGSHVSDGEDSDNGDNRVHRDNGNDGRNDNTYSNQSHDSRSEETGASIIEESTNNNVSPEESSS